MNMLGNILIAVFILYLAFTVFKNFLIFLKNSAWNAESYTIFAIVLEKRINENGTYEIKIMLGMAEIWIRVDEWDYVKYTKDQMVQVHFKLTQITRDIIEPISIVNKNSSFDGPPRNPVGCEPEKRVLH
jgi:hypothetical protein